MLGWNLFKGGVIGWVCAVGLEGLELVEAERNLAFNLAEGDYFLFLVFIPTDIFTANYLQGGEWGERCTFPLPLCSNKSDTAVTVWCGVAICSRGGGMGEEANN